jgi:hypothetical protein
VPVVIFYSLDEDEILAALIHANKQRQKSNTQLAREAAVLFPVEEALAAKRRQAGQEKGRESRWMVAAPPPSINPEENVPAAERRGGPLHQSDLNLFVAEQIVPAAGRRGRPRQAG